MTHQAGVLRLTFDTDAIVLRPHDKLLGGCHGNIVEHDGVTENMPSAVTVTKQDAPIIERLLDMYDSLNPDSCDYHSLILPRARSKSCTATKSAHCHNVLLSSYFGLTIKEHGCAPLIATRLAGVGSGTASTMENAFRPKPASPQPTPTKVDSLSF